MHCQGRQALVALVLIVMAGGCFGRKTSRDSRWMDQFRQGGGPNGPHAVFVDYALIQKPRSDLKLSEEIWPEADEQVLAVEQRALLEANGFRVGRFGQVLPAALQAMLSNPGTDTGYRQRRLYIDGEFRLATTKPLPAQQIEFKRITIDGANAKTYRDCELGLCIVPKRDESGKLILELTPEVHEGQRKDWASTASLGLWNNRTTLKLEPLRFSLATGMDESILIGAQPGHDNSTGDRLFRSEEGAERVLLLRAGFWERQEKSSRTTISSSDNNLINQASRLKPPSPIADRVD
jgi:hypothetical protein